MLIVREDKRCETNYPAVALNDDDDDDDDVNYHTSRKSRGY